MERCKDCIHLCVCGKYEYDNDRKDCQDFMSDKLENQRIEINRLRSRVRSLEQSRNAWKEKANRVGKQLFDVLGEKKSLLYTAYDFATLADWYINSVNEKDTPLWTEEHLTELLNDFHLIPKEN